MDILDPLLCSDSTCPWRSLVVSHARPELRQEFVHVHELASLNFFASLAGTGGSPSPTYTPDALLAAANSGLPSVDALKAANRLESAPEVADPDAPATASSLLIVAAARPTSERSSPLGVHPSKPAGDTHQNTHSPPQPN